MTALHVTWDLLPTAAAALVAATAASRRPASRAMAGLVLVALALASIRVVSALGERPVDLPRSFQLVTIVLLILGGTLVLHGFRCRTEAGPGLLDPGVAPPAEVNRKWLGLHLAAAAIALATPRLHLLLAAIVVSAAAGWWSERRQRAPWLLALALLLLAGCWYLLARVAGPMTLALDQLREAPFSPAFEVGLAAGLLLAASCLLGIAPLHWIERGPVTPILGGVIVVRLATMAVPGGLAHWQPVAYPVALLSALWAIRTGQVSLAILALAATGLLSGDPAGGWAGIVLVGPALAFGGDLRWIGGEAPAPLLRWGMMLMAGVSGAALVPALAAGLAAEAVYTATIALVAVTVLLRFGRASPR